MPKRYTILPVLVSLCLLLMVLLDPDASYAIGKVTATPTAERQLPSPEELDIDSALEEVLEHIEARAYADAIALAAVILQADEGSWKAHYYRGFAHARSQDWEDAIADYSAALDQRPGDAALWRARGELHLENRNPRAAKRDYQQSLSVNPRATATYSSLVRLHERDRDSKLRELYQSIVDAARANAGGNGIRAIAILDEAIGSFDRGSAPPELGYAYFARAEVWTGAENWDSALADLSAALALQPQMQDYYMARGYIYSETERQDLAAPDFHRRMTLIERDSTTASLALDEAAIIEMEYALVARLQFEGEAGQLVSISARDYLGKGVDPLLVLLDVDGKPLLGDDDGGGETDALIANYELPARGAYTVMVGHANGGFEGQIRVTLR
ncbi:MAG: tetratricopeptide repeat protein [Chloroflexi bacterium]|nr:tetratricopeptide repeat protein [Chloroflexota bacterium]